MFPLNFQLCVWGEIFLFLNFRARFHYERGIEYSLFVLLIFLLRLALAYILGKEKSMKETKNAPFHAPSGNESLLFFAKYVHSLRGEKSMKETKNVSFHARNGNEFLLFFAKYVHSLREAQSLYCIIASTKDVVYTVYDSNHRPNVNIYVFNSDLIEKTRN